MLHKVFGVPEPDQVLRAKPLVDLGIGLALDLALRLLAPLKDYHQVGGVRQIVVAPKGQVSGILETLHAQAILVQVFRHELIRWVEYALPVTTHNIVEVFSFAITRL